MYIAGIHLSHNQGIDTIAWLSTLSTGVALFSQVSRVSKKAIEAKGPVTVKPQTLAARISTSAHIVLQNSIPLLYLGAIAFNGFEQPLWLQDWAFPDELELTLGLSIGTKAMIRTVASLGLVATTRLLQASFNSLGADWAVIGIREKGSSVARSGPYAYIRHPLYGVMLLQQVLFAGMFWSYLPLASLAGLCVAYRVKAGAEEKMIEDSDAGDDYRQYKKDVPYRFIPYVW